MKSTNHVKDEDSEKCWGRCDSESTKLRELLEEALDSFERQVHACEDPGGKTTLDEMLAATVTGTVPCTERRHP